MPLSDQEFERALLASARQDEPPAERSAEMTTQAWARFSARAAAIGDVVRGDLPRRESPSAAGGAVRGPRRIAGSVRWRWLMVGALGGSAVTGALVALRPSVLVPAPTAAAGGAASPVTTPAAGVAAPAWTAPRIDQRPPVRHERRRNAHIDRDSLEPAAVAEPPSTLGAEVAALDAARAAAAGRQFDEALRLISRYHYDFPMGELAADAEVIAIEVLDAKNDRPAMTLRASRFVQQHPDDPHAARIRRLLGSPPSP